MIGFLFLAFRSLYTSLGSFSGVLSGAGGSAKTWFDARLGSVFTHSWGITETGDLFDWDAAFATSDFTGGMDSVEAVTSLRASLIGVVIMLLGVLKLFKKLVKYVVGLIPNLLKVIILFVCAPLGLSMYASPETQQKANSYIRTFAAAALTNLLKVMSIGFVTILITSIMVNINDTGYCLLDTYGIATAVLQSDSVFGNQDIAIDIAFIMTSGGLLGMNLYVDLLSKTCDVADRFAQEVLA